MDILLIINVLAAIANIAVFIVGGRGVVDGIRWLRYRWRLRRGVAVQPGLRVLNFAHPFTEKQLQGLETLLRQSIPAQAVHTVGPVNLDHAADFDGQIDAMVVKAGIAAQEWETGVFVVNLPGFSPAAGVLLAELHGRMGHFPMIVRMQPADGRYEVAEVINLQATRDTARRER